jgi:cytochrome P450
MPPTADAMFQLLGRFMSRLDGDRHHAVRSRFARVFTPKRTAAYADLIVARANSLLDAAELGGAFDLVADYARPLPFGVISDVLGVPPADQPWLERTMAVLGASFAGQRDPAVVEQGNDAAERLIAFFDQLMAARAASPADDLLSILAGDELATTARDDLLTNCVFFLLAGHATTTTLIAAGAAVLCQHRDQLRVLQAEPERWGGAVEELLRFISPITVTGVSVPADVPVNGHVFRAGSNRLLCFAAANRDPEVFQEPDVFDIGRVPNSHLAFSVGPHHCLGAPLARLHGAIALRILFSRLPELRLVDELSWRGSAPVRQLERVAVSW